MADDAEDIGGISVSVGASHRQLASDLAEADRLLEAWAKQHFTVQLAAQVQQPAAGAAPAQAARAAAPAQRPAPVTFGPGAATRAQAEQGQTAAMRAINAELAKTGERYNAQTGEIEKITESYQRQRVAVQEVAQAASQPVTLDFNTEEVQNGLNTILVTLKEITTAAVALSRIPAGPDTDEPTGVGRRSRRKNIRDRGIGTEADPNKIYTFDPAVYEEQDRIAEAKSARQREALVQQQERRAQQQAARMRPNQAAEDRARAANYLNANPPPQNANAGIGATDINAPGYRSNEEAARRERATNQRAASQRISETRRDAAAEARAQAEARRNAFDLANSQATQQAFAQSRRVRQYEANEEAAARQVASRRAAITGAGRTSRTLASGLGALFGGTEGRQIEAQAAASQAARQLVSAERAIAPLDSRLRQLERTYAGARGETRKFADEQMAAIRNSDEYRGALLNVEKAVRADAAAQTELAKISSAGNVARNLVAITTAGAAFGIGLKAVDTLISAIVPAMGNYIDMQTGFGATSTRVTTALAQQTLALRGNVDAALAGAEAQAGLSAASSDALNNQLRLTTQIKAGAQAQQLASDLFRAGAGVGNAPSGLFGGYGGIGGTGLLAQQMGGGRGFTETVAQDVGALGGRGGPDILGAINAGLAYVGNRDVRTAVNREGDAQGNPLGTISRIPGGLGDLVSSLNPLGQNFLRPLDSSLGTGNPMQGGRYDRDTGSIAARPLDNNIQKYLDDLNAAAGRGAEALGSATQAQYRQARSAEEVATGARAAAAANDPYGVTLAQQHGIVVALGDAVADAGDKYREATQQFAVGRGIQDPAQIARQNLALERQRQRESAASLDVIRAQQDFARPAQIAAINRQQQYALNTQLPAQAALQHLAAPSPPVGTGIAAANAVEQGRINAGLKEANDLQQQLNTYYEQGKQVLIETYQVPPALLASVESVGRSIASIQAGISNQQAAYQVAQYNHQLVIARRSLADIGGLTGKNFGAGQSYLGTLERQNLQLSRQGQLLQFNLSQRQINFQTALAGFQAPGVTPEERQARIKEAQIEAGFAQKQLDIQRQMFGNQVQIVDISNLRQGADLAAQIGLLLQGRQVTIDTAVAEQRLLRLQALQAKQVAQVGTYLTRVDALAAAAMSEIQQLEAAAGRAMTGLATQILSQFGLVITGLTQQLNGYGPPSSAGGGGGTPSKLLAGGALFSASRATDITVGEAGNETVAVLRNPRAMLGSGDGGGGGAVNNVNFYGDMTVRSEADITAIAREVTKALGRQASNLGLRGIG